jgi:hypothetical protein
MDANSRLGAKANHDRQRNSDRDGIGGPPRLRPADEKKEADYRWDASEQGGDLRSK